MEADEDVCFRHKADILTRSINVRFRGQSAKNAALLRFSGLRAQCGFVRFRSRGF